MAIGMVNVPGLGQSAKGAPGGLAALDDSGKVPAAQLPEMDYVPNVERGQANGVAQLDATGRVPESQLPTLGGHTAQKTAPANTKLLWIDTSDGNILKFYDSESQTWKPVGAVWS